MCHVCLLRKEQGGVMVKLRVKEHLEGEFLFLSHRCSSEDDG